MFCFGAAPSDLRGLPGRASPRHGLAAATQQHQTSTTHGWPHKNNFEIPSVFMHARSSFCLPLNCLCSLRSGREELYSSFLGRRGSLRLGRVRGSQT